jgi:hypothetical protein
MALALQLDHVADRVLPGTTLVDLVERKFMELIVTGGQLISRF